MYLQRFLKWHLEGQWSVPSCRLIASSDWLHSQRMWINRNWSPWNKKYIFIILHNQIAVHSTIERLSIKKKASVLLPVTHGPSSVNEVWDSWMKNWNHFSSYSWYIQKWVPIGGHYKHTWGEECTHIITKWKLSVAKKSFMCIDLMSLAKHFGQGIQDWLHEFSLRAWNAQGFT